MEQLLLTNKQTNKQTFNLNLGLNKEINNSKINSYSFSINTILSTKLFSKTAATLLFSIAILSSLSVSHLNASDIETVKDFKHYPLSESATGASRGGGITDIQSAKDGIGTIVVSGIAADSNKMSNKDYSKLIQQKLSELETTNNLKDSDLTGVATSKLNNNEFVKLNNVNGTPCVLNTDKHDETWVNNICQGGVFNDGVSCTDNNDSTSDDKYISGECIGTQSCALNSIYITNYGCIYENGLVNPNTNNSVPILINNNDKGYILSSTPTYTHSYSAYNLFNNKKNSSEKIFESSNSIGTIIIKYPQPIIINKYAMSPYSITSGMAKNWVLYGSNDNSSWKNLNQQNNQISWNANKKRTFSFTNTIPYLYYKLDITSNNGRSYLDISELILIDAKN